MRAIKGFDQNILFYQITLGVDAIKKAPIADYDTGIKCVRVGDMTNSRRINQWAFSDVNEEKYQKYQLKKMIL